MVANGTLNELVDKIEVYRGRDLSAKTYAAILEFLRGLSWNDAQRLITAFCKTPVFPQNILSGLEECWYSIRPQRFQSAAASYELPVEDCDPRWWSKYIEVYREIYAWHRLDMAKWYVDNVNARRLHIEPLPNGLAFNNGLHDNGDCGDGWYAVQYHFCIGKYNRTRNYVHIDGQGLVEQNVVDPHPHDTIYEKIKGNIERELEYMGYYQKTLQSVRIRRGIDDADRPKTPFDTWGGSSPIGDVNALIGDCA